MSILPPVRVMIKKTSPLVLTSYQEESEELNILTKKKYLVGEWKSPNSENPSGDQKRWSPYR